MKSSAARTYLAITVEPSPAAWRLSEDQMRDRVVQASPIFHSWLRKSGAGIVGVRFSSWMINQGYLSRREKDIVNDWNRSEADFEVFFGPGRDFDSEGEEGEETRNTCIIKLEKDLLAISLPLFGAALGKQEAARLEQGLAAWDAGSPSEEDPVSGESDEDPA